MILKIWLLLLPLTFAFGKQKIYDCFLFFNELEMLEVRLHEMYDHVDHFVLVECLESFTGNPKILHYARNKERFKEYEKKIIHVIVTDRFQGGYWEREYYQRNQIMRGLANCAKDDIVIISDLDEVVRGFDVQKLVAPVISKKAKASCANLLAHAFYLNRRSKGFWSGPVATTYAYLKKKSPQTMRDRRHKVYMIDDIGWHFSCLGGLARYITKVENFSHAQEYTSERKDPQNIFRFIQEEFALVPIDESYPRLIWENQEAYLKMGFVDYEGNSVYQ